MRIFIGLREISGYYSKLHIGLQVLGIDSTFVSTREHVHQYGDDDEWLLAKAMR